jgi:hypothetical protein
VTIVLLAGKSFAGKGVSIAFIGKLEGVVYDSIVGASKELNISKHTIRGRLNNKSEKFKNWIRIL